MIKKLILAIVALLLFEVITPSIFAQDSESVLYVPLIGLTSVPKPLALPKGPGDVTYHYAVKNFLDQAPLTNVQVTDDKCHTIKFVTGDDNNDSKLDYGETWRYSCTTKLSQTTQSIATATGTANNITASHKAYATVVVGSEKPPPLVSVINITKVAYPLSLPVEGGKITFTYKVNNPGVVPLSNVVVADDKCKTMSGKLGDTNGNNLLDTHEVWIYHCATILSQTTTNTVRVSAFANGLKAIDEATLTVKVNPISPGLPELGSNSNLKIYIWKILSGISIILTIIFLIIRKRKRK